MRGLKGKTAIVAGAAPGNIGGATAVRLAQEGMKVIAADLNQAAAQALVDEIKSAGGHANQALGNYSLAIDHCPPVENVASLVNGFLVHVVVSHRHLHVTVA